MRERIMSDVVSIIENCFDRPEEVLGKSEDSCHIKVVFMLLWELGWDPVRQIMLGFEIPKERMGPDQQAAVVPDIVVADEKGTYLVGEVKHWFTALSQKHIDQIIGYKRALNAPYGFLTNGRDWMVFGKEHDIPILESSFGTATEMLTKLRPLIGPGGIRESAPFPYSNALNIGLSMNTVSCSYHNKEEKTMPNYTSISWISERYDDPWVKRFVHELAQLANEYSDSVYKDEGKKSLLLKDKKTRKKYIEYWPRDKKIFATRDNHRAIGVPKELSDEYHRLIAKAGNSIDDALEIIDVLRRIIDASVSERR